MASRSQTNLFSILIIIVGIVGGYLYYTQFDSDTVVVESDVVERSDLDDFERVNLNLKILDLEAFKALHEIVGPVEPGPAGRKDLFAPIP